MVSGTIFSPVCGRPGAPARPQLRGLACDPRIARAKALETALLTV
jgi:hypothetical protein